MWGRWRAGRVRRERATSFVHYLLTEPAAADVAWLALYGTSGDVDHAEWELRYARRAAGLIVAGRDALDDRTASVVSAVLLEATHDDPNIDAAKRDVAAHQFNVRLTAYRDALAARDSPFPTATRLGRVLLHFAGQHAPEAQAISGAGDRVTRYLVEAHEALEQSFGAANLPEDVRPSDAALHLASKP
jgi:hypothetical protein